MNHEAIAELFIRAAETDRRLPNTARPARLKAQALPYTHDERDQAGWGGERYQEERQAFWDNLSTRLKASDISDWEFCNDLIHLVADESQRRCLWNWAIAKAGGLPFSTWCQSEGIHVMTGGRRKDRAIYSIHINLSRNTLLNNDIDGFGVLPVDPELDHIHVNIGDSAPLAQQPITWRADDALSTPIPEERDFSWAEKRNEMRRQREANKRQAA